MQISELAARTSVALPTLKYYLREGLLMPGASTGRTRADYSEEHVERVRLIRALLESGGIGIAGVRAVIAALEHPPASPHEFLGRAHAAIPPPAAPGEPTQEVEELLEQLGWDACRESPLVGVLATALGDARAAGVAVTPERLRGYAAAAADIAGYDVDAAVTSDDPTSALRYVVVGTVLLDPVLATLRRLAQEVQSARVLGVAPRLPGESETRRARRTT